MDRYPISEAIVQTAKELGPLSTPAVRTKGFSDMTPRGTGDVMDLVGSFATYKYLAENGSSVSMNMTAGGGDLYDLTVCIHDRWFTLNVKTSKYGPVRPGLNLMVKEEEQGKSIDGYVQVFVHLDRTPDPHVHFAGFATASRVWSEPVQTLPRTGGHQGVMLDVQNLRPLSEMVQLSAAV